MNVEGQKRAARGGEFGPNGEWYDGGRFIATSENTIKSAPVRRELSDEEKARRAEKEAERAAQAAKWDAWITTRRALFTDTIAALTRNPGHVTDERWALLLETGHAGFLPSLGRDLSLYGRLSEKQARYVADAMIGRRSRKNEDEWETFFNLLTEQ
jgi:hypothetical protein